MDSKEKPLGNKRKKNMFDSITSSSTEFHKTERDTGISEWSMEDVKNWLTQMSITLNNEELGGVCFEQFKKHNVDGYIIRKIFSHDKEEQVAILKDQIQIPEKLIPLLMRAINFLSPKIEIDIAREIESQLPEEAKGLVEKIRNSERLSRKIDLNDPSFIEQLTPLYDKEEMKKVYLTLDWQKQKNHVYIEI